MSLIASRPPSDLRFVISAAIAVGTVGLAAIAGSGRLPITIIDLPLALGAMIGLVAILLRIDLGVALVPLVATAVPFSLGTGTQTAIVASLMFAGLLLAMWVVRSVLTHELRLVRSPVYFPTVALVVVWIVAYVYANAVRSPLVEAWPTFALAQVGGLAVVVISAGVMLLALNAGRDLRRIQIAAWSIIGIGVWACLEYYLKLPLPMSFLSLGGLFTMWAVALAYGQALFNQNLPTWSRCGLVVIVAGWLFKSAFQETFWFSGWAPPLVVVLVLTLLRSRRAFAVLLPIVATVVLLNRDQIYQIVWGLTVQKGDLSRLDIWQEQLVLIGQYPLLGTGPAGYAVYNVNLFADSLYAMSTHSNYLDVLAETGIVGAVIFGWFVVTLLVVGWRACRRYRSGFVGGYANAAYAGLFGVLFAMGLGDWFIPFVYNQTIAGFRFTVHSWVFLGFLAFLGAERPTEKVS
jgi:O-antigen ligase